MKLPNRYMWLSTEGAPKMLVEAIKHYGLLEVTGKENHPDIMRWAKEVGVNSYYPNDETPWCGLFMGIVAKRCGYGFNNTQTRNLLRAKDWATWGEARKGPAKLWDVLVFSRSGGGHVGFYVGENKTSYLVFGGNQSNSVSLAWIAKDRCISIRKPIYKIGEPSNVRTIKLLDSGELSKNEQ